MVFTAGLMTQAGHFPFCAFFTCLLDPHFPPMQTLRILILISMCACLLYLMTASVMGSRYRMHVNSFWGPSVSSQPLLLLVPFPSVKGVAFFPWGTCETLVQGGGEQSFLAALERELHLVIGSSVGVRCGV